MGTLISQGWSWSPLVERQGPLNLLLWSEAFDNAAWTKARSYIAANCAADPTTGLYTVDKLVEDGTVDSTHPLIQSVFTGGKTISVLAKAGGRNIVELYDYGYSLARAWFNLSTGALGSKGADITASSMTDYGNGWYLCTATSTATSTGLGIVVFPCPSDNVDSYSGLGHQGTAAAGGSTTQVVLAAGASATDSVYNATEIIFSDAPTTIHTVTAYVGATLTATFTPARASAPDTKTYTVGPGIYIARAQLNPGTTLRPYRKTTG